MLKFAADENFHNAIVRGLRLRFPDADIVRVQDTDILGAEDPTVLEWCAYENRVLLTHDVATMSAFAYQRVADGLSMPGVFEISTAAPIGAIIEELSLILDCSLEGEWEGQVRYLPLR